MRMAGRANVAKNAVAPAIRNKSYFLISENDCRNRENS